MLVIDALGDFLHSPVPVGSLTSFSLPSCALWPKMSHRDEWMKAQNANFPPSVQECPVMSHGKMMTEMSVEM